MKTVNYNKRGQIVRNKRVSTQNHILSYGMAIFILSSGLITAISMILGQ